RARSRHPATRRWSWHALPRPLPAMSRASLRSCDPRCERGGDRLVIAERQNPVADDLARLVTLARDQQHVARLQRLDCRTDRMRAVADLARVPGGIEDRGTDRLRLFAPRIIVRDDDMIGVLARNRAHQRALAGIAIAACAEHDHELAL